MKELETTQELVLLREAIELARNQGNDFLCGHDETDVIRACAQAIADATCEIDMLLTVDGKDDSERKEAQKMMHLVLFHKTLTTSGSEDESCVLYYEHVLALFSDIGWPVYIECVWLCEWHSFAIECWSACTPAVQTTISERVFRSITNLADANVFPVWQWLFRTITDTLLSGPGTESSSEIKIMKLGLDVLDCAKETGVKTQGAKCLVDVIKIYAKTLECSDTVTRAITETLHLMSRSLLGVVSSVDAHTLTSSLDNSWILCLDAIDNMPDVCNSSEGNLPLKETVNLLRKCTVVKESQDERLRRAVSTVASNCSGDVCVEAKKVLLDHLEKEYSSSFIECLQGSSVSLSPAETLRLVEMVAEAAESEATEIKKVIFQKFAGWPIKTQDEFRQKSHDLCRQLGGALMDSHFHQNLTETMNKMSLSKENEVTRDLSLLCLKSPLITINALIVYATNCGQGIGIAEILSHLKSSCTFEPQGQVSVLVICLKKSLEESTQANQVTNMMSLLKELISIDILPVQTFLSECVFMNARPSQTFVITLKIIQVILTNATSDVLSNHVRPAALFALLAKSLHHCMVVDLSTVKHDIHAIKNEALIAQRILLNKVLKTNLTITNHEVLWLWNMQRTLHKIVRFSLHPLFLMFGLDKYPISYKDLPLDDVLVALSLSKIHKEIDVEFVTHNDVGCHHVITNLVVSLAQVLPRLTLQEITNLMANLSKCIASSLTSMPHVKSDEKIRDVQLKSKITTAILFLNTIIRLRWRLTSIGDLNSTHLDQTVHFCGTAIRNVITTEPHLSMLDLTLLTYVATCLTKRLSPGNGTVGKLLILDLLNQMQTLMDNSTGNSALGAVNVLKDFTLGSSTDELDVHISKLVHRFCFN